MDDVRPSTHFNKGSDPSKCSYGSESFETMEKRELDEAERMARLHISVTHPGIDVDRVIKNKF